jgi:hypothetical protein
MTFAIHYSILGYLCFRESDAKRGRLIKAHCDQARKGAGTVGKLRLILELDAQRERLKAILDLNRSRYASSSNVFFDPPTVHFALRARSQWALISRPTGSRKF